MQDALAVAEVLLAEPEPDVPEVLAEARGMLADPGPYSLRVRQMRPVLARLADALEGSLESCLLADAKYESVVASKRETEEVLGGAVVDAETERDAIASKLERVREWAERTMAMPAAGSPPGASAAGSSASAPPSQGSGRRGGGWTRSRQRSTASAAARST